MKWLVALWAALVRTVHEITATLPWRKAPLFLAVFVEDFPERPERGKVYLAGEGRNLWGAAMRCPCGCGDTIELNLLERPRPSWSADVHSDNTVTLTPSVWRQKACQSHFILRRGHIIWT